MATKSEDMIKRHMLVMISQALTDLMWANYHGANPKQSIDKSAVNGDMSQTLMDKVMEDGAPEGATMTIHCDDRELTAMIHILQYSGELSDLKLKAGAKWFPTLRVLSEGTQPVGSGIKHEQLHICGFPAALCNILQVEIKCFTSEVFFSDGDIREDEYIT